MNLIFIDPGVKINGTYYSKVLLTQKLLPVMCEISSLSFSKTAHRACKMISLESSLVTELWKLANICQSYKWMWSGVLFNAFFTVRMVLEAFCFQAVCVCMHAERWLHIST